MTDIRSQPCSACPYRKDVPSGLWAAHEYDKLRLYDEMTPYQPRNAFSCHATPDHYCHGWAVCHTSRDPQFDLLALRIRPPTNEIPPAGVELFASGNEAADHGQRNLDHPSDEALRVAAKLIRKYPRLRK